MLLYVFRHGIAIDRGDPECPPDSDRFLTEKGVRRTRRATEGLVRLDAAPDLVICSPWTRAVQTAELVLEAFGLSEAQLICDADLLPMSNPATILHKLADLDVEAVMLVGHAPHLDLVLDELSDGALIQPLTKAGAACMELDPRRPTRGLLRWLLPSKGLRRLAPR